ncbi:MAG: lamin tail domain-containing protein [Bacteroidales bacterium]|nr:lamin tail domain-containing protein [Bacteroidales bacterium]
MNKLNLSVTISLFLLLSSLNGQEVPVFVERIDMGEVECFELTEASGIVESRQNPHVLWSHNDRNHHNRLFAMNKRGKHLGAFWIDGIQNRDWEDIAIGPGPEEGKNYIYIGDIGDNNSEYDLKYIYRIAEPYVNYLQEPVEETITDVEIITFQYPDGKRDAETIMLDPLTKDLYVVSKREFEDIRVYRAPFPQSTTEVITLDHVISLNLWQVVSGDISSSGLEILLKTYTDVYYWNRQLEQDLWEAFNNDPILLPYVQEMQGEAIGWAFSDQGYYTLSEENIGIPVHLYFYPRNVLSTLVINEIMPDPVMVEDEMGEWFEIYNHTTKTIDMDGWTIRGLDEEEQMISQSILIDPGDFLVFGNNSDTQTNGGVQVDWQYSNIILDNSEDKLLIISPSGTKIDSVSYETGSSFPYLQGASMALLNPNMENNLGLNWVSWTTPYGDGDFGTPGTPNLLEVQSVTIRDIQFTTDLSGISPLKDQRVSITGVLSREPFGSFYQDNFFIQDDTGMYSGIMVKYITQVEIDDSIKLTGTVADGYGGVTTLIDISDFEIYGKAVDGIEPATVNTGQIANNGEDAEAYEGVLITTSGICNNDSLGWHEWSVDDGSGTARIYHPYINDFVPIQGKEYEITGIQYFRDNNFKMRVINRYDIVEDLHVENDTTNIHAKFELHQNLPNPFYSSTTISFNLPIYTSVKLTIYSANGEVIDVVINQKLRPGKHSFVWDTKNIPPGIYFYTLKVGDHQETRKCVKLM